MNRRSGPIKRAWSVLAVWLAVACVSPVGPPDPTASGPSVAPRTQQFEPSPSPSASAAAAGPAASPAVSAPPPSAAMLALLAQLPGYAGAQYLDKRLIAPDELADTGRAGGGFFQRILAAVGASASDVEGAQATGGSFSVVAIRIPGVAVPGLASAVLDSLATELPGGKLTSQRIAGHSVSRVQSPPDGSSQDLRVFVVGDVVYLAGGRAGDAAVVEALIASMYEPKLELKLPATIGGQRVERYSFPGSAMGGSGDICTVVCPGEPQAFADRLGVKIEAVDMAAAYTTTAPAVIIVAFRVEGAKEAALIDARIAGLLRDELPIAREVREIGGKSVTWVVYTPLASPTSSEILYAHDEVLYSVRPLPEGNGPIPVAIEEAVRALP